MLVNCYEPTLVARRAFPTRAERAERLEAYAKELERELEGVRERISELRGE